MTEPNTPRTFLKRAWEWFRTHPEYSIPLLAFLVGAGMGKWVF